MSSISTRQILLDQLAALRLSAFRQALEEQFASPHYDELSFEERLALLIEHEHLQRQDNRLRRRLRQARFQQTAMVQDIDFSAKRGLQRQFVLQLANNTWIHKGLNLIVIGPTGAGKNVCLLCAWTFCVRARSDRPLLPPAALLPGNQGRTAGGRICPPDQNAFQN